MNLSNNLMCCKGYIPKEIFSFYYRNMLLSQYMLYSTNTNCVQRRSQVFQRDRFFTENNQLQLPNTNVTQENTNQHLLVWT